VRNAETGIIQYGNKSRSPLLWNLFFVVMPDLIRHPGLLKLQQLWIPAGVYPALKAGPE
jgi:hypothetical protein